MEEVLYYLKENLLRKKDIVVVAVSGGADSMALLSLLLSLKQELSLTLVCAHVNHNMRKESAVEKAFVESYCKDHGIFFECMEILEYGTDNFHMEARQKRYAFFDQLCRKYKASYLLTAHHGDDLMETVFMRMARGSTLRGYSGFAKCVSLGNYKLVRPFISITKDDIYAYCKDQNITFFEDASNQKMIYTRNRYRKYILPFLKEEDPLVHRKILKFSETLLEYYTYVQKQLAKVIKNIYVDGSINIEKFQKQDAFLQQEILYFVLEDVYQEDLSFLCDKHIELLQELIASSKPNASICLPRQVKAVKEYQALYFKKGTSSYEPYEKPLLGSTVLPNGKTIAFVEQDAKHDNFVCHLCKEDLHLPLLVRSKKSGDRMEVKGMQGSKKIKDIFIDEKIPYQMRLLWPIVTDSDGKIVWIPGLKKSKFDTSNKEKCDIILRYY